MTRTWNLKIGDPQTLVLSADFRFCQPDMLNDHTWEIASGKGDTGVLGMQTTYGLRAHLMRIMMSFKLAGREISNPQKFFSPPVLNHFFPNYLGFTLSPFLGLDIHLEYWLPSSQTLACRLTFRNQSSSNQELTLELSGELNHMNGQPLSSANIHSVETLTGRTSGLEPVIFLTGGPKRGSGIKPALVLDFSLASMEVRKFNWVQAALPDVQSSFDLARRMAARVWDAEIARIFLTNEAQLLDIETGDEGMDAALAFSQVTALRLFFKGNDVLPHPSFVLSRQPDHGYSARGDGRDLGASWNGQSVFDCFTLASLLPGAPGLIQGLVLNFLATRSAVNLMDNRPTLTGQHSGLLAAPLLATLSWQVYQHIQDREFLQKCFQPLVDLCRSWFTGAHDRDSDGFPEWDHPQQTGFEDNPWFNFWRSSQQGIDIRCLESPALAACLAQEIASLELMATELGIPEDISDLPAMSGKLRKELFNCWDNRSNMYTYRDRDTHLCEKGKRILVRWGSGVFGVKKTFKQPVRCQIRLYTSGGTTRALTIFLRGKVGDRPFQEKLDRQDFRWAADGAISTCKLVCTSLDEVEVVGLQLKDRLVVSTLDAPQFDQTCFLPLWAGIPDRDQAHSIVHKGILNPLKFKSMGGISNFPSDLKSRDDSPDLEVHFPWNHFIGSGMLHYGFRKETVQLVSSLMETSIKSLREQAAFFYVYRANDGKGVGERNHLHGLAPLGLFLQALGVTILSPDRVHLEGENPFPWTVKIKFRGLTIIRKKDVTEIQFPNGNETQVHDTRPCLLTSS